MCLGIDAPTGVFHYPVIRVERIDSPHLQEALSLQEQFTHLIVTSKNGVRLWPGHFQGKKVIAIGEATAKEVMLRGALPLVSKEERQEGIAKLMDDMPFEGAFILYLRSKRARPFLEQYLKKSEIRAYIFDLYDTIFQRPEPVPDLYDFDEIVFTSPSTVEAFGKIFAAIPKHISIASIGPITQKAVEEYCFARI